MQYKIGFILIRIDTNTKLFEEVSIEGSTRQSVESFSTEIPLFFSYFCPGRPRSVAFAIINKNGTVAMILLLLFRI